MAGNSVYLNGSVGPSLNFENLPGFSKIPGVSLGYGLPGFYPQKVLNVDSDYDEVEQNRFKLVQAWNNVYKRQLVAANKHRVITPFRAVNNAGDLLSRQYYSCGGPCQSFQSRPNLKGLRNRFGNIHNICDGTGIPSDTCNVSFVYDSSDYSRYLKQQAIGKNYNDSSFGGDKYNASQVAIKAVRRY